MFDSELEKLSPPNCSNVTEKLRCLKYVRNLGFFRKKNFFKIVKGGEFAAECASDDTISQKCLFHLIYEVFWQKIRTFLNL